MPARFGFALGILLAGCLRGASGDRCSEVSPEDAERLAHYVAQKYHVPAQAALSLESNETVGGTCFRKLVFRGDGALGPYRLILFSAPDLRFLSSDLLDSSVDPEGEERAQAAKKVGQLLEGEYAATGAPDALVTLVVFSDFQCPYCRRLREILSAEPLITPAGKVRLIFRHFPAPDHDWAQKAAEAASCAQLQSAVAFWSLHDALFENQQEITAGNFSHELANLVARIATVNADAFNDCMARQISLGIVLRDRQMAAALGVKGTPTMFINGEMRTGLPNAVELHQQLQRALDGAVSRAVTGK